MLNYGPVFCQIKRVIFLLGALLLGCSCSSSPPHGTVKTVKWSSIKGNPIWFKGPPQFCPKEETVHPFFDLESMVDYVEKTVNFFVVTPAGSPIAREFEIVSGKFYKKYEYCEMEDPWHNFRAVPKTPPYTEGVVPRILDQLGTPLKIRVFGREDYYAELHEGMAHMVRVVGGVVEQYCEHAPCDGGMGWESRMILIAVDPLDERYANITTIAGLKKVVDWEEVLSFMQSGNGVGIWNFRPSPIYRVVGEILPDVALRYSTSFSKIFQLKELNSIRRTCYRLYDHLWQRMESFKGNMGVIGSKEEKKQGPDKGNNKDANLSELTEGEKENEISVSVNVPQKRVFKKENVEKRKVEEAFRKRLAEFYLKYGRHFKTCLQYVAPANIAQNPDRHWFFAFLAGFHKLYDLGFIYDCWKNGWKKDPSKGKNKLNQDPFRTLQYCSGAQLDRLFGASVAYMGKLKEAGRKHFRYIEYDNVPGGTHQKIFSWVPDRAKPLPCKGADFSRPRKKTKGIFPGDVHWQTFIPEEEVSKEYIY